MFQSIHNGELELLRSDEADIYVQGAQLTRFRDWLFLSERSHFAQFTAIRGGVPVIFPWFGPHKDDPNAPQHGLVRTCDWKIENAADDAVTLAVATDNWRVRMKYGFAEKLRMRFEVENLSDQPLEFECALHTYFAVDDVHRVRIEGLDGKTYLDKTDDYRRKIQHGDVTFSSETDRAYMGAPGPIAIGDGTRTIHIVGAAGWRSTVVWNPWSQVAAGMKDLGADEWERYVCVECGAIADDAVILAAGENYALDVSIAVEVDAVEVD